MGLLGETGEGLLRRQTVIRFYVWTIWGYRPDGQRGHCGFGKLWYLRTIKTYSIGLSNGLSRILVMVCTVPVNCTLPG